MAVAARALWAAALARAASADVACTAAHDAFQANVSTVCDASNSTCAAACIPALRDVLTACEGGNYTNSTNGTTQFDKGVEVALFLELMDAPCHQAAVDLALASGRCNENDCMVAADILQAGSALFCQLVRDSPQGECPAPCVTSMNAVYQRCQREDSAAGQAILGAKYFMSLGCKDVLRNNCSYGDGCGYAGGATTTEPLSSGTTTEPPCSGTTAENQSDPETCPPPPPPPSTTGSAIAAVSLSARAAALSLFAVVPVATLIAS